MDNSKAGFVTIYDKSDTKCFIYPIRYFLSCGYSSVVERHLPKVNARGSSPLTRFLNFCIVLNLVTGLYILYKVDVKFIFPQHEKRLMVR